MEYERNLRTREAAEILKVSVSCLQKRIKQGKLDADKIKGVYYVSIEEATENIKNTPPDVGINKRKPSKYDCSKYDTCLGIAVRQSSEMRCCNGAECGRYTPLTHEQKLTLWAGEGVLLSKFILGGREWVSR